MKWNLNSREKPTCHFLNFFFTRTDDAILSLIFYEFDFLIFFI
jgi:hypothetical protein